MTTGVLAPWRPLLPRTAVPVPERLPGEAVSGLCALAVAVCRPGRGEAEGPLLVKLASLERAYYHLLWGKS